jgi:hypothetical protein
MIRKKYCGTAAKAGGNGENKPHPEIMGVPYLLEKTDEKENRLTTTATTTGYEKNSLNPPAALCSLARASAALRAGRPS